VSEHTARHPLLIGIDFDNTLVSHERGLKRWAETLGTASETGVSLKAAVRQYCRESAQGDALWQEVQADLYGPGMAEAQLMPGAEAFLVWLACHGIPAAVVSHKTRFAAAAPQGPDLREAAMNWMAARGLFGEGYPFARDRVFFAATRAEKAARIKTAGCTHFVDDLAEVFLEPDCPGNTRCILFAPEHDARSGDWLSAQSWREVRCLIEADLEPCWRDSVSRTLGTEITRFEKIAGGRNSRIYRADSADGARYAVKRYAAGQRLANEREAVAFLKRQVPNRIPEIAACSDSPPVLISRFIEGRSPKQITGADIDAALAFLDTVNAPPQSDWTRPAAEALTTFAGVETDIRGRIEKLLESAGDMPVYDEMRRFLKENLLPLLEKQAQRSSCWNDAIPGNARILSPSDFGFHNALRRADGGLAFFDFEYFGWDDPAKTAADFLLHPAMDLSDALKQRFVSGMKSMLCETAAFAARLPVAYTLFGIKWPLILLNEFLPHHRARRAFAGDERPLETVLREQLEKARAMAARTAAEQDTFPYTV
jgi:hypothetical protein